jgi:hypothetical protein
MSQTLSLERFAELTVRMTSGETRSDVLKAAEIDEATWEASQAYWLGKMANEAGRDRYSLAQRYGVVFQAAQVRLGKAKPKSTRKRATAGAKRVVVHAMPVSPPVPAAIPSSGGPSVPPASLSGPSLPPSSIGGYAARLTLEQLAAMRAEIATAEDGEQPNVLQRFGLDTSTWEKEEAHWQRKLALDEALFKRYLRQFQYCKSLLQRR